MATPTDIFSMLPQGGADPFARLTLDDLLQTVMREGQSVIASDPTSPLPLQTENIAPSPQPGTAYAPPPADLPPRPLNAATQPPAAPTAQNLPEMSIARRLMDFGASLQGRDVADRDAQNATFRALTARGLDPQMVQAAIGNPGIMQQLLAQTFRPRTQTLAPGARLIDDQGRTIANNTDNFAPLPEGGGVFNRSTGETMPGTGAPRAPAGFEWVDPADRSKGLRAIPGGPGTHLSSEVAGRLALMNNARSGIARARQVYERAWSAGDFARQGAANLPFVGDLAIASGEQGEAQREIRTGVEAALRTMTGAAAPETEVARYTQMFTPTARDTVASAKQKLDNLDSFMAEAARLVNQGRSATPPPAGGDQSGDGWREVAPGVRIRERR